jgi:metallo-beta-lactamase family protein
MATLTFLGAAETVTGSKYLLESQNSRLLIDCGLFQGLKQLRLKNWEPLPIEASTIRAVVLTHAHIDHLGYLPRLVKSGFQGPVFGTPATCDLAGIMLFDSARNQEDDAEYANRKKFSKHAPALPLYDSRDVEAALKLFRPQPREAWFEPASSYRCRYHDDRHLLGSAMIESEIERPSGNPLRVLFSGDVGRYEAPLYHDPLPPPACDYLICESTYGNREHPATHVLDDLARVVNESVARGGVMVVAAFAVGRAQQLIYLRSVLMQRGLVPRLPIYLDSPMSAAASEVYHRYANECDFSELGEGMSNRRLPMAHVHLTRTVEESKRINEIESHAVIIASSGMMTGGRILHHLQHRLPESRNTILLGGFMADGTRGRALQNGARFVRIFGHDVPVRASVREMSSLSGHAGHSELRRWLEPLPTPRRVFITHGELESATALANELHRDRQWNTHVPHLGETVELT